MTPHSFLTEWCFQALTERMTLTRLELWHRFQSASDYELAKQFMPSNSTYSLEEVTRAVSDIRTANAGDLGEFALFALGLGSVPLRPSDLTDERRDTLINLELIALRAASAEPPVKALAKSIQPMPPETLRELARKYNVSEAHVTSLEKKDREISQDRFGPIESKLPDLVVHSRDIQSANESGRRIAQLSRLLSMP